jgi:hypothetical protein
VTAAAETATDRSRHSWIRNVCWGTAADTAAVANLWGAGALLGANSNFALPKLSSANRWESNSTQGWMERKAHAEKTGRPQGVDDQREEFR